MLGLWCNNICGDNGKALIIVLVPVYYMQYRLTHHDRMYAKCPDSCRALIHCKSPLSIATYSSADTIGHGNPLVRESRNSAFMSNTEKIQNTQSDYLGWVSQEV